MKQTHAKGRGAGKATGRRAHRKTTNNAESASDTGAGTPQSKAAMTRTRNSAARVTSGSKPIRGAAKRAGGPQSKTAALSPKATINAIHRETGCTLDLVTKVFRSLGRIAAAQLGSAGAGMFTIPEVGLRIWRLRKPGAESQFVLMGVPLKRLIEATGTVRTPLPA